MIKAVIFDCFGVLTTEGWGPFKQKHLAHDQDKLKRAIDLNRQLDAGQANYHVAVAEIAELAGVTPDEVDRMLREVAPDKELLDYIRTELKPKYKIGMLSNVSQNWLDVIFEKSDIELFDATALSYEASVVKPQPEAYEGIADQLGVDPKDCVFIDDSSRNVAGAKNVGMQTILYKDFEQMKPKLENLLAADTKS